MRATQLNLGSGQRPFKAPFVNVDCQARWSPDVLADIRDLSMFESDSAEVIVLFHCIEHFGCGEADCVLKECFRVLRTGGKLFVVTPDLKALAEAWLAGRIDDYIYTVNLYGAFMGDEADRHKWNWSHEGLESYVKKLSPWTSVERCSEISLEGADCGLDWWMSSVVAMK